MRIGVGSYTFSWGVGVPGHLPDRPLTAFDLLERASVLAVDVVQYCDNLPLTALGPGDLSALAREADAAGIGIEVGARGLDEAELRTHATLAAAVGSPILRLVVTDPGPGDPVSALVARLRPALPALRDAGVTLALENHEALPCRALVGVVEALGPDAVGVCLDTANSCGAFEAPAQVVDLLAQYTVNVHVKDFTMRRAWHGKGFVLEGAPVGEGDLDVPRMLDRLRAAGRDPSLIVELWTPWQGSVGETVTLQEEWARRSVAFLRTVTGGPA